VLLGDVGGGSLGEVGGGPVGDVGGGPLDASQSVAGGEPGTPDETQTLTGVVTKKRILALGSVQVTVPFAADDASTTYDPRVISSSASVVVTWSIVCPITSGMLTARPPWGQVGSWHPGDPFETSRSTADP
jgi:hypothetical protein